MSQFKRYLVSYRHDGAQWNLEIPATSQQDAEQRLSKLTFGKVDGEIIANVPGSLGPIALLAAQVRNLLHAGSR